MKMKKILLTKHFKFPPFISFNQGDHSGTFISPIGYEPDAAKEFKESKVSGHFPFDPGNDSENSELDSEVVHKKSCKLGDFPFDPGDSVNDAKKVEEVDVFVPRAKFSLETLSLSPLAPVSWFITTSMFITTSNPAHGTGLISAQPLLLPVSRTQCVDVASNNKPLAEKIVLPRLYCWTRQGYYRRSGSQGTREGSLRGRQ